MKRAAKLAPANIENVAADWIVRRDAGLTTREKFEFDRWLAADPRHAAAVVRNDETWAALDRPRQAGQGELILQQLGARAWRRRRRRHGATAAALSVLLVAGLLWQARSPVGTVEPAAFVIANSALVVRPETRTLPDGSVVELKADAEIVVNFDGPMRRVALRRGEAHFQVAKNPKTFVVAVGGVEVRAVGTAFSVQLGAKEIEVLVTEGRVAVEQPAAPEDRGRRPDGKAEKSMTSDSSSSLRTLANVQAGNRIVVPIQFGSSTGGDFASQIVAISSEELDGRLAWRAPRIELSDTSLSEAVALMQQHSRVRFVIADASLAAVQISGFFRADNSETFVRMLEASFGVSAERSGDKIILRKAK